MENFVILVKAKHIIYQPMCTFLLLLKQKLPKNTHKLQPQLCRRFSDFNKSYECERKIRYPDIFIIENFDARFQIRKL